MVGVPWRLILYRNRKKRDPIFFTKKSFFLTLSCFLITFIWRRHGLMNGDTFAKLFARKKTHFLQFCSQRFLFFWYKDSSRKSIKKVKPFGFYRMFLVHRYMKVCLSKKGTVFDIRADVMIRIDFINHQITSPFCWFLNCLFGGSFTCICGRLFSMIKKFLAVFIT